MYSPTFPSVLPPQAGNRPFLTSYDSGQECSLEHWIEVSRLVEKAEDDLGSKLPSEFSEPCHLVAQ
jgi:hypothetical protein